MSAEEAERRGFLNRLVGADTVLAEAQEMARVLANGPTFARALTKRCLHHEWAMSIDDAIKLEAEAQALCMQTDDFVRAYGAFVARRAPVFEGD